MRRIALPGSPRKESAAAGLGAVTGASAMGTSVTVVAGVLPAFATAGASAAGGAHMVAGSALATAGMATGATWLATVGAVGAGRGAEAAATGR